MIAVQRFLCLDQITYSVMGYVLAVNATRFIYDAFCCPEHTDAAVAVRKRLLVEA